MEEQGRLEPRTCCALILSAAFPLLLHPGGDQHVPGLLGSHQGGFGLLGQTILPMLRWLAGRLSRGSVGPLPIQVLLGAQRVPPPAQHLSQLVRHELFFQVVVQVAHSSLGLVRGFHLTKKQR